MSIIYDGVDVKDVIFDGVSVSEVSYNGVSVWVRQQFGFLAKIQASDKAAGDSFGYSVAVGPTRIVVGAYGEDTGGSGAGAAYIWTL